MVRESFPLRPVPQERIFSKIIRPNSSFGTPEGSLSYGVHNVLVIPFPPPLHFPLLVALCDVGVRGVVLRTSATNSLLGRGCYRVVKPYRSPHLCRSFIFCRRTRSGSFEGKTLREKPLYLSWSPCSEQRELPSRDTSVSRCCTLRSQLRTAACAPCALKPLWQFGTSAILSVAPKCLCLIVCVCVCVHASVCAYACACACVNVCACG